MGSKGNIVKTYQNGNSTVHICSDHFVQTPEEKAKVIKEMHRIGWMIHLSNIRREEEVEHTTKF